MRIVQVIPYFSRKRGGDVNVCYHLSKELGRIGHEVKILTSDFEYDSELARSTKTSNVEVISFESVMRHGLFIVTPAMKKWLRENRQAIDIVHVHDLRSYQSTLVSSFARTYNTPYVLQAHGSIPRFDDWARLKWLYDKTLGRRVLDNAMKVLALNETEAMQYRNSGVDRKRIEVLPNGIDLQEYAVLPEIGTFRKKHGITEGRIILYLGRLHSSKGIDLLIDSMALLRTKTDDVKLVIVGPDDGHEGELKRRASLKKLGASILFTGYVSEQEKLSALIDSDLLVVPVYSGFPIVFLEACHCGVPIVTTTKGDRLEWLQASAGDAVEYDEARLAGAIATLLDDQQARQRIGKNCRQLVRDHFDWIPVTERLVRIYEAAMEDRGDICH